MKIKKHMLKTKVQRAVAGLSIVSAIVISGFMPDDLGRSGIDVAAIDKSVSPKTDFYQYANGTWLKNNPVPADQPRWGSFDVLADANNKKIKMMVEEAAADKGAEMGTPRQKLRDFYNTAMDTVAIESQGITLLKEQFYLIDKISNKQQLIETIATMHKSGFGGVFNFYVYRDIKKSDENICYFSQGGLGLPDRDYYTKTDDKSVKIREEYLKHVSKMLSMSGDKNPDVNAKKVMAIETIFAKASKSRVDLRDDEKNYNRYDFGKLIALTPSIDWNTYLTITGATTKFPMSMNQPEFYQRLNTMFDSLSVDDWKAYLNWHLIHESAPYLSSNFINENFSFYGTILSGTKVMRPRWKRVLNACDEAIGEVVGKVYVDKYFSESSKIRVKKMVDNLLAAYKVRIQNLDWMSPETKLKALEKLSMFNTKLGYPDKWKDYSKLEIKTDGYIANMIRSSVFDYNRMIAKLGQPVDKSEWQMLPHQVNAYYEPTLNEIVFPAAIMQPPFFYPDADDAVNYGAIGAVIGHEITHGFDDQGSKYDGKGNLSDWWTDLDRSKFDAKSKVLIEEFNAYEALPGLKVNGELTIGENIADLGGITTSLAAYHLSLGGKPAQVIDGFTGDQRYFLAFAQVWRGSFKDEYLRNMVLTNEHSPGNFRAYTVTNLTEFYQAFDVKPGDKMYREEAIRAKIW